MPSRNRKKRSKQRAEYLQKQDDILSQENKAKARARYKADPEKKKASVRDSYHNHPKSYSLYEPKSQWSIMVVLKKLFLGILKRLLQDLPVQQCSAAPLPSATSSSSRAAPTATSSSSRAAPHRHQQQQQQSFPHRHQQQSCPHRHQQQQQRCHPGHCHHHPHGSHGLNQAAEMNGTFILNDETAVIFTNHGPVCVGGATSTVKWIGPSGNPVVVATAATVSPATIECGTFVDSTSLKTNLSKLFTTGSICSNIVVFTCVITEVDGSTSELYVGSKLPATADISVTFSTVPPSVLLNCTTSALAVSWTVNGVPVGIKSRSKLLSGVTAVRISHILDVTTPTFGNYSCVADAKFGGTSATVSVSPADVTPEAPIVAMREVGTTFAVLQLSSHPSPSPPTLLHNITYMGGCSTLTRTLVTPGNSSSVNITGLGEGSVYSFSIYSLGVLGLSSHQATTLVAQTNPAAPSSWPLALQEVGKNSTNIFLSWLELSCDSWKGLNRSYVVLYSSGREANVTITSSTPNVTISNLKPSTVYWFRVAAVNEVGTGPYSPATNATTQSGLPTEGDHVLIIVTSVVGGTCLVSAGTIFLVITFVRRCRAKKTSILQATGFSLETVLSNRCGQDCRPPVIEQFPDSCFVSEEGCCVVIEGRVTGYPPPTCQWRYNGENLNLTSNELTHMREGGKLTLPVMETGVYIFIATNHLGSAEATIHVTVACDSDEDCSEGKSTTNSPSICGENSRSMIWEKPVPVSQFQDYVVHLQANLNYGFHYQYKCLPSGAERKAKIGQLPENRHLNRLPKIIPYDDNRVIIHPVPRSNDVCNEYINASYIDGHNKHKKFIATQGPLQSTLESFWRMVWQEEITVMVMLCDLVERGKVMCQQYWPDGTGLTYGPFLVTLLGKQETHPHYIVHNMQLRGEAGVGKAGVGKAGVGKAGVGKAGVGKAGVGKAGVGKAGGGEGRDAGRWGRKQGRQIKHYKFTSWPEHGVPDNAGPLLALRQGVDGRTVQRADPSPLQVSSYLLPAMGVGRTGVFIALDCTLEQAKSEGCVDVMGIVSHPQGPEDEPGTNRGESFPSNGRMPQCGKTASGVARNEAGLLHASYADGYEMKKAYIIAEGPMKHTCDRFWHMVFQERCGLILMLSAPKEHSRETCHVYWPL
eukprot:Em0019g593a